MRSGNNFTQDNCSVNFMPTAKRGKLAKAVREARVKLIKENRLKKGVNLFKYSHDENGVLKVKKERVGWGQGGSSWHKISSISELESYIAENYSTVYHRQ